MTTETYSSEELKDMQDKGLTQTDWEKVDACAEKNKDLPDEDVDWTTARPLKHYMPKQQISFRVENDLLEWLKKEAVSKNMRGYQSLMHSILETYRQAHSKG